MSDLHEPIKPSRDGVHVMVGGLSHKTERCQTERHLYLMKFFDVEDFWRSSDNTESTTTYDSSHRPDDDGDDWHGTRTWEEALELGLGGWTGGRDKINEIMKNVVTAGRNITGKRRTKLNVVAGARVNVPRALSGNPDCMTKRKKIRTSDGQHIKVAANLTVSAGVRSEDIMARGAAIAALINRLDSDGYSVELIAYNATAGDNRSRLIVEVPVKRPEDVFDAERVAMMFAHTSSMRRGIFAVQERVPEGMFEFLLGGGYGQVTSLTDRETALMRYTLDLGRLNSSEGWSDKTAEQLAEWVSINWKRAVKGATNG